MTTQRYTVPAQTPGQKRLKATLARLRRERELEKYAALGEAGTGERLRRPPQLVMPGQEDILGDYRRRVAEAEAQGTTLFQQRKPITGWGALQNLGVTRPLIPESAVERLPAGPLRAIGREAREMTSPLMLGITAATAGLGPTIAGGIRGGTGIVGAARGLAAGAVEPIVRGRFPARLAAENIFGVGAGLGARAAAGAVPETAPTPVKVAAGLAGGLVAGAGGLAGTRAMGRVLPEALVRAPGRVLPEAGLKVAGKPSVAGAAPIALTKAEAPARITRFLKPEVQSQWKDLMATADDMGIKTEAVAGVLPDEYFIVLERTGMTRGRDKVVSAFNPSNPNVRTFRRLFFGNMEDARTFLNTGEYTPPSLRFGGRPIENIKPEYVSRQFPVEKAETASSRAAELRRAARRPQMGESLVPPRGTEETRLKALNKLKQEGLDISVLPEAPPTKPVAAVTENASWITRQGKFIGEGDHGDSARSALKRPELPDDEAIATFIQDTGSIRYTAIGDEVNVDIRGPITPQQLTAIGRAVKGKNLVYDIWADVRADRLITSRGAGADVTLADLRGDIQSAGLLAKPVAPAARRVAEESDALVRARLARKAGIPLTPDEETALAVAKPVRPARGGIVPSRTWETGAERPFAFDPNSTANQGRFRLLPAKPQGKYITRQSGTPGVSYIVDTETNAIQSVRFNKAQFPEAKATEWWEANKGRFRFSDQAEVAGVTPSTRAVPESIVSPAAPGRAVEQVSVPVRRTRARVTPVQQAPPPTRLTPEESTAAGVTPSSPAAAPPAVQRVPGGARAEPLEPRRVSPRQPSVEAGAAPPGGRLPSGREVGGPGRAQPPPPRDPYGMLKASLEPERDPLINRVRTALPQEAYDRNFPLKELEKATGIPTRKSAQVVPGAIGAGEDIVRRFYEPIVKTVQKDLKFLERYMVLMRGSDILSRNPHARLPGGIANEGERQIALAALQKDIGAARFAKLEQAAAELWRANDEQVLRPWLDEGIITPDMYREMKAAHPHYIPFMRDDFAEVITNSFAARPEANLSTTGIRRMGLEGSERTLSNPLMRLLQQPYKAKTTIFRNRAAKSIVRTLEELQRRTGEDLVRYIDPKKEMNIVQRVTGENIPRLKKGEISQQWETISFFENGVKNRVEVPSIYGRVAKGLEAEPDNLLLAIGRVAAAPLRLGATTFNPWFTPVNVIRDAMSAMFREKLFPFGPDYLAGLWAVIRKNADFSDAAQSGALLGGVVENMAQRRIVKNPLGRLSVENPWDAVTFIPRVIEEINILFERGVRVGTFRKLRAEGLDQLEAAVRSRDATVDFAKAGHAMRAINQVIPFTNAAVQGSANIVRTIRDHPARSAAFAAMFTGVAVTVRVNNMRFETSELIPDYEYTRNWVVQFGEGTRADGTKYPLYLRIPKGEIAAIFTFVPEALFNLARRSEDRSAAELLLSSGFEAARAVSPIEIGGVTGILPPALETGVGVQTGIDPFTGFPIVPERLQGLPPEQQFTKETSQTAIQIGKLFKISPMTVDFALRDVAAGGGQTVNWLASMGLEALGVEEAVFGSGDPDADLPLTGLEKLTKERTPGLSRFIGTRDTQLRRRGYDNLVDAVVDTNRAISNFPDVSRLGIKFGQVQGTIGKTELTPQQKARYQELAGQLAIEGLTKLQSGSGYFLRTDANKEERIREVFDEAREDARALVLREIREGAQLPQPAPTPSTPGTRQPVPPRQSTTPNRVKESLQRRVAERTPIPVGAR